MSNNDPLKGTDPRDYYKDLARLTDAARAALSKEGRAHGYLAVPPDIYEALREGVVGRRGRGNVPPELTIDDVWLLPIAVKRVCLVAKGEPRLSIEIDVLSYSIESGREYYPAPLPLPVPNPGSRYPGDEVFDCAREHLPDNMRRPASLPMSRL